MGLFDGFDKPVTKGDLWTAIAGVKIYEAKEKAREEGIASVRRKKDKANEDILASNERFFGSDKEEKEQNLIEAEELHEWAQQFRKDNCQPESKKPLSEKMRRKALVNRLNEEHQSE